MSKDMLGGALREACGPLKDLMEKLMGVDGLWWLNALKKFLRKENPFLEDALRPASHFKLRVAWERIYKKYFRVKVDLSSFHIPEKPEGEWWMIMVANGMGPERIFQACKRAFGAWKWTDKSFDDEVAVSDRSAQNCAYAVWVRANVEADEQFNNFSANQLSEKNHHGITLEERMLLELMYFEQTGKHLDIRCWTLCSGSRFSDGNVPVVNRKGDESIISRSRPDEAYDSMRSRQVAF